MILHIKNMVSARCIIIVKIELDKLGLQFTEVELGTADIKNNLCKEQHQQLKTALLNCGLELISDKKAILIEKIKRIVIDLVHFTSQMPKINNSNFISDKLQYNYIYLANIFSEETGITIEHFIINHKIERVKELIRDDELNLSEISYLLNYSSIAYLSRQFKHVTGLTMSCFKNSPSKCRLALENM